MSPRGLLRSRGGLSVERSRRCAAAASASAASATRVIFAPSKRLRPLTPRGCNRSTRPSRCPGSLAENGRVMADPCGSGRRVVQRWPNFRAAGQAGRGTRSRGFRRRLRSSASWREHRPCRCTAARTVEGTTYEGEGLGRAPAILSVPEPASSPEGVVQPVRGVGRVGRVRLGAHLAVSVRGTMLHLPACSARGKPIPKVPVAPGPTTGYSGNAPSTFCPSPIASA